MPTTHLIYISDSYLLVSSVVRCTQFINAAVFPLLFSQWCLSDPRPAVEVRAPAWAPTPRPLFLTCMKEMMEHLIRNSLISLSLQKIWDKKIPSTLEQLWIRLNHCRFFHVLLYIRTLKMAFIFYIPCAIAASLLFSSGLSCSIVWMTGNRACLSLPDRRKMNCRSTFFRYSRLATLFSRSWFRSRRRSSLFNNWQEENTNKKGL